MPAISWRLNASVKRSSTNNASSMEDGQPMARRFYWILAAKPGNQDFLPWIACVKRKRIVVNLKGDLRKISNHPTCDGLLTFCRSRGNETLTSTCKELS